MNIQIFEGATILVDAENLVSLTDLYKIAAERGMADGKLEPKFYFRKSNPRKSGTSGNISNAAGDGLQFVEFIAENLKVSAAHIYKTTRGKGGGTFAHWQIALAYAKYLSHELHMRVNETYMRAQTGDVTLAAEIAEKQKDPKKTDWLAQRVKSIHARNILTDTLSRHGVKTGVEIAKCTNTVYKQLFHATAKEIKERRGIPEKANLRDNMSRIELAATEFAELLASERIEKRNETGFDDCNKHCGQAARIVANAVSDALSVDSMH